MKLIYKVALLFMGFATIASCSEDDFHSKPVLDVSTEGLTFSEAAGVKSINVTVNKGDQALYSIIATNGDADWVTVLPTEQGANVSVRVNKKQESREVTIKVYVLKGDLEKTITVKQDAGTKPADGMELSEVETEFNYLDHELSLYVTKNVETPWEANCAESWVTLTPDNVKNTLAISIEKNTTIKKRTAKITVTSGILEQKLELYQDGFPHFDLPFLGMGFNYEGPESGRGYRDPISLVTMGEFEKKRGGKLLTMEHQLIYTYSSNSAVFSSIIYKATSKNAVMVEEAWLGSGAGVLDDGKYFEFLVANGFKHIFTHTVNGKLHYWNEKTGIVAICNKATDPTETIRFIFTSTEPNEEGNQTSSYRTMATIPLPYTGFAKGVEDIKTWEASKGGKLNGQDAVVITFTPDITKEPEVIERAYFTNFKGTPNIYHEGLQLFRHIDYGYYPIGASLYEYNMTNEFKALLASEGFVFDGSFSSPSTKDDFDLYFNAEKKLAVGPYIGGFDAEDLMPRFCLAVFYQETAMLETVGEKRSPMKVTIPVKGDGFEAIKEAMAARRASK